MLGRHGHILTTMYQKFIITNDGVLKFGTVHLHRDLIPQGDDGCHGGGFWQVDELRGMIILHGRSYDYGPPDFKFATSIDRNTISDLPTYPVFYRSGVEGHEKYEPIRAF